MAERLSIKREDACSVVVEHNQGISPDAIRYSMKTAHAAHLTTR